VDVDDMTISIDLHFGTEVPRAQIELIAIFFDAFLQSLRRDWRDCNMVCPPL
jgi:hypothetical protein